MRESDVGLCRCTSGTQTKLYRHHLLFKEMGVSICFKKYSFFPDDAPGAASMIAGGSRANSTSCKPGFNSIKGFWLGLQAKMVSKQVETAVHDFR